MIHYTEQQKKAIAHRDGNLLLLACAGSGKTEVVSRRIAELVRDGVNKNEIVAFTFTERAADALKSRIRRHLDSLVPNDPALGDMYVGTIHSFCLQVLKQVDPKYRNYEVMDEARQAALIMSNFYYNEKSDRGIGLNKLQGRTRTGRYWNTVSSFVTTLSVLHQQNIDTSILDEDLRFCIERYQKTAYGHPNFFFDYDQIISKLISRLKKDSGTLKRLRGQFKYLIVDEYQDVDDRQEELVSLLSDRGKQVYVTVVGDDDQSIYGWRGAKADNIINFRHKYPRVEQIGLYYNFRSTHAIVEIASRSIRNKVAPRIDKEMEARHFDLKKNSHVETLAENGDIQLRTFPTDEDEAEWIADRIEQLHGTLVIEKNNDERAIDYADMAILLRSVRSSGADFVDALRSRGIPVIVKGVGGLFDQDEIRLLQAIFCYLARSNFYYDDAVLEEADIREYIRKTIRKLNDNKSFPGVSPSLLLEWCASERADLDKRNLEKEKRGGMARRIYPQHLFQEVLKQLGVESGDSPLRQDILFNFGQFSSLITQFEAVHQWVTPYDLKALCIFLGGWAEGKVDEGGIDESITTNAVQVLTVHAAKGLEWPVVFIPRVSSRLFPSSQRGRGPETFFDAKTFNPKTYAGGDEGERRLWYVALTRCVKFLNITSRDRPKHKPTQYFKEIKHDIVQRHDPIQDRPKGNPTAPDNIELFPTTYSDLNYYWRCPFEYQLRSLMGFSPGVKESYGYGQQIHNVLAEIHKNAVEGQQTSPEEAEALMEKRFHLRYTRDGEVYKPFTELKTAAKQTVSRYLREYPDERCYVLEAEKPFEFIDQKSMALITGTVDLLQRIDDCQGKANAKPVGIVDFKTHGWSRVEEFEAVRKDVSTQLQLYALAVKEALGMDAQKAHAFFLSRREPSSELRERGVSEKVEVDISSNAQKEVMTKVRDAVQGIRESVARKDFAMKGCDRGFCPKCDFKQICPGLKKYRDRNPNTKPPKTLEEEMNAEMQKITGKK